MRKSIKIVGGVVGVLLLAAGGAAAYIYTASNSVPDYYASERLTGEDRIRTIESMERKLGNLQGQFDKAVAETRLPESEAAEGESAAPEPVRVAFTASEMDTYLDVWLAQTGFADRMGKYMNNPRIAFVEGRLVLAGTMPDLGDRVISLHLLPAIGDDGRPSLTLDGIYAGNFPLPKSAMKPFEDKTVAALSEKLPQWQSEADIDETGAANDAAKQLATNRQLMRLLERLPVDQLILFPPLATGEQVPARVTAMAIEDEELTLAVVPLTRDERAELLAELRTTEAELAAKVDEESLPEPEDEPVLN